MTLLDQQNASLAILAHHVANIRNPALRRTCSIVLDDPAFRRAPASISYHHTYTGGLLSHTAEVCDLAAKFLMAHPAPTPHQRFTIIAAAVWHDYLKIDDYIEGDDGSWSVNQPLRDTCGANRHIIFGAEMFCSKATPLGVDQPLIDSVVHCILSHHGRADWGSPVEPETLEALLLHSADMSSAKFGATKFAP